MAMNAAKNVRFQKKERKSVTDSMEPLVLEPRSKKMTTEHRVPGSVQYIFPNWRSSAMS